MPRRSRKAPDRPENPLDMYSTWDIRIARLFYYLFVVAVLIIMVGLYVSILLLPNVQTLWDWLAQLDLAFQIALIGAIVTAHILVLVFFYSAFRGGIFRMCRILYKNRKIARKYEDKTMLRWLVGILLLGVYFTIFAIIIGLVTENFLKTIADLWIWMVKSFNVGHWILWLGLVTFCVLVFFFFIFVIWNDLVYVFLRMIAHEEEKEEVDIEIKRERVKKMSEEDRMKEYTKDTGRAATIRGRETRGYKSWKKKMGVQ